MGSSESEGSGSESNGGTGNEGGGTGEGDGGAAGGEVRVGRAVGGVHLDGLSLVVSGEGGVNLLGVLLGLVVGDALDGVGNGSGGGEAAGVGGRDEGGLGAVGDHDETGVNDGNGGSGLSERASTDEFPGGVRDPGGLLLEGTDDRRFREGLGGVADEVLGGESLDATTHDLARRDSAGSSSGGNLNLVSVGLGEDGGGGLDDGRGGPGDADVTGEGDGSSFTADGVGGLDECNSHDEEII